MTLKAAPAPAVSASRPVEGVLWMLATGLCFVGVNGIVRHLGADLPAPQSAFLRFGWGVIFLIPALLPLWRQGFSRPVLVLFGWRGLAHSLAVIFWFYAMARLPVAEVTAIGYLNPMLVTLGAALFFGETLSRRRLLAAAIALVGALVILRPGLRSVTDGHLAQLAAACFFAGSYLLAKRLSQSVPAGTVVAMMSLTVALGLMPLALWVWVPVTASQVLWLGLVALCATAGHYCMTRAFTAAPLTVTQPVTFLQLVWATLLGAAVFGEPVDLWVLLGGAIIIAAITWITFAEARRKADPTDPAPGETP